MIQKTKTDLSSEIINQPQGVNPRAIEMIAALTEEPGSLIFSVEDIGDEQCVVARIVDLTPDMMAVFEAGAGESDDPELQRDWMSWRREIEQLGGASNTEVQAVRTGERGRKKEIQVAFFGLRNTAELMQTIAELNDIRKKDGIEAQEGLPDNIAYLPDTILAATREMRANSVEELQRIKRVQDAAIKSGATVVGSILSRG